MGDGLMASEGRAMYWWRGELLYANAVWLPEPVTRRDGGFSGGTWLEALYWDA